MMRTSTGIGLSPPTGSNSRSCSTRSSLACSVGFMSPISSRKSEPPLAYSMRPIFGPVAPVKAPLV